MSTTRNTQPSDNDPQYKPDVGPRGLIPNHTLSGLRNVSFNTQSISTPSISPQPHPLTMQQIEPSGLHFCSDTPAYSLLSLEQPDKYPYPAYYGGGHMPPIYHSPPPFAPPDYNEASSSIIQPGKSSATDANWSIPPLAFPHPNELPLLGPHESGSKSEKKSKKDALFGGNVNRASSSSRVPLMYLGTLIPDPFAARASLGVQKVKGYFPKEDFKTFNHYTRPEVIANDDMVAILVGLFMKLTVAQMGALDDYCVAKTGKSLSERIEALSVNSDWKFAFKALSLGPVGFDVELLRKALTGFGTNEMLLIELILGRQAAELRCLNAVYKARYGKDLTDEVRSDIGGKAERLFIMALNAQKPVNDANGSVDEKKVAQNVDALYQGAKRKDEATFCEILVNSSDLHLAAVITAFSEKHDKALSKVVKKTFSGTMAQAMVYIIHGVKPKRDKQGIWRDAKLLEKSMAGFGTRTTQLTYRIIRAYWNPERLEAMKFSYQWRYHKYLELRVKGETSGVYQALLLQILKSSAERSSKSV